MKQYGPDFFQLNGYEATALTWSSDIYSAPPPTNVPVWYFMARRGLDRNVLLRACASSCLQHDHSEHSRQRGPSGGADSSKWFVEVGSESEQRIEALIVALRLLEDLVMATLLTLTAPATLKHLHSLFDSGEESEWTTVSVCYHEGGVTAFTAITGAGEVKSYRSWSHEVEQYIETIIIAGRLVETP